MAVDYRFFNIIRSYFPLDGKNGTNFANYLLRLSVEHESGGFNGMCAHVENIRKCPLCEGQPSFSRNQIAFLEDVLINQGCMRAMMNGKASSQPEKCRECALILADIVDLIRNMREH